MDLSPENGLMARVRDDAKQTREDAPIAGVLFDLDGTLIDHFETLFRCYEYALGRIGRTVPSREVVRRTVGGSMEVTMRKLVDDPAAAEIAGGYWREHLDRIFLDDVRLMPGARELVSALHERGLKLAVFTNKIGDTSRAICQHLGLGPWLDVILGANDTPYRKPQREFSLLVLERLGVTASQAILVGDSPYDLDAANAVDMRAAFVTTGTHSEDELRTAGAAEIFSSLTELGRTVFGFDS